MELQITEEEVVQIDDAMNDHVHGHAISNNIGSWTCNPHCRRQALGLAINRVLAVRDVDNC